MGGAVNRQGLGVGLGFGVVTAALVLLLQGGLLMLLLMALLAAVAGMVAAHLAGRILATTPAVPVGPAAGPGGLPPARSGSRTGAAAVAGAVMGVVTVVALTLIAATVLNNPSTRSQIQDLMTKQGISTATSLDGLLALGTGCVACVYLLLVPTVLAGLAALGAVIYGLVRPVAKPPPAAAPPLPPLPGGY